MGKLRTAVVGVGYLGSFHAQKYAAMDGVELIGVADTDPRRAAEVGAAVGVPGVTDYRKLLGRVDLVSVAVPTARHHAVALDFLRAGAHVLVEKPIARTLAEADALIEAARTHDRLLQVGHLERYNPAWLAARPRITHPLFIEAHRLAPYKPRGTDVGVVLDLMVHDLDLVLAVVDSPVAEMRASGTPVLTEGVDIANARIAFENGCIANITASRVSSATLRKMRIFQKDEYLSVDFQASRLSVSRKAGNGMVDMEQFELPSADALLGELRAFVAAVAHGRPAPVTGEDGRRALALALEVGRLIADSHGE